MFSPSQVSHMLEIPASTLRRYAVQFAPFLSPSGQRKNRRREYTQADVLTFQKIRDYSGQGLTPDEIAARLPLVDSEPATNNALALIPDIAAKFEEFAAAHANLNARLENQDARIAALEAELSEKKIPWYKKLLKK